MSSERQEYNEQTPWWGEHLHRYQEALQYVSPDMRILDIATGNGFGAYLLAEKAAHVTGADISAEAIAACNQNFKKNNLTFAVMDGTALPFNDNDLDMVVSFETIEHTTQYENMVDEFWRCIKKGGKLVVSTPNIVVNSPGGKIVNPYHTQEFNYDQLENILSKRFNGFQLGGQAYIRYQGNRKKMARFSENILYRRGIRKLPIKIQDKIMQWQGMPQMYPVPSDYTITYEKEKTLTCKTFFAVCTK